MFIFFQCFNDRCHKTIWGINFLLKLFVLRLQMKYLLLQLKYLVLLAKYFVLQSQNLLLKGYISFRFFSCLFTILLSMVLSSIGMMILISHNECFTRGGFLP
jgi:hypothetical protein